MGDDEVLSKHVGRNKFLNSYEMLPCTSKRLAYWVFFKFRVLPHYICLKLVYNFFELELTVSLKGTGKLVEEKKDILAS